MISSLQGLNGKLILQSFTMLASKVFFYRYILAFYSLSYCKLQSYMEVCVLAFEPVKTLHKYFSFIIYSVSMKQTKK